MGVYRYTRAALRRRFCNRLAARDIVDIQDDQHEDGIEANSTPAIPQEEEKEDDPSEVECFPETPPEEVDYTPTTPSGAPYWPSPPSDVVCDPLPPWQDLEEEEEEEEEYSPTTPPVELEEGEIPPESVQDNGGEQPTLWGRTFGETSPLMCIMCPTRPATHGDVCLECWQLEQTVDMMLTKHARRQQCIFHGGSLDDPIVVSDED